MGFLSPWFLAGVAAIGVPLYLHLLRRHTTNPHPVGSLMFFEQRTQSSIKHRRLRYLLLLSLRLLLLLLLGARFRQSFPEPPGRQRFGRQARPSRYRQFLQHARRFAPGRCEARCACGSQLAQPRPTAARSPRWARSSTCSRSRFRMPAPCARPSKASSPAIPAEASGNLPARCARFLKPFARPSSCIFSATCSARICLRISPSWPFPRMSRWCCIR